MAIAILAIIIAPLSLALITGLRVVGKADEKYNDSRGSLISAAYFANDVSNANTITKGASAGCGGTGTPIVSFAWTDATQRRLRRRRGTEEQHGHVRLRLVGRARTSGSCASTAPTGAPRNSRSRPSRSVTHRWSRASPRIRAARRLRTRAATTRPGGCRSTSPRSRTRRRPPTSRPLRTPTRSRAREGPRDARRDAAIPNAGSSLILALAMITIISVAIVAVLGYAATSFRTVTTIREQRDRAYAADGAVETAIASLRKLADEGAVGSDDRTARSSRARASTTPRSARRRRSRSAVRSSAREGRASRATPCRPTRSGRSAATSTPAAPRCTWAGRCRRAARSTSARSTRAGTSCSRPAAVRARSWCSIRTTTSAASRALPIPTTRHGRSPTRSDLDNFNPPPICEGGGTLQFRPGLYTEASMFEEPDYGGCANGVLYFRPGVYYFDFGFADDDHVWNMGDTTIVGGEPKGWNPNGGHARRRARCARRRRRRRVPDREGLAERRGHPVGPRRREPDRRLGSHASSCARRRRRRNRATSRSRSTAS